MNFAVREEEKPMFEGEAIYSLITHIGNSNYPDEPSSLYSLKAGGNSDTDQKYRQRKAEYKALMQKRDRWFGESCTLMRYAKTELKKSGYWSRSKRSAMSFFLHAETWSDIFIKDVFGNIQAAYWQTETKDELAGAFLQWFDRKKEEMRKKMTTEIQTIDKQAEVLKLSGKQITHGGIANLLKVLTRTMEKQGADIRSIAKVQYTICKQAGILIPDEFIEDVAVILTQEG